MGKNPSDRRVRAAAPVDGVPHSYFVFADGQLLRAGTGSTRAELIAEVPNVREVGHGTGDGRLSGKELEIRLYAHGPWVCVTERFGVNASLINTATGMVRELSRADYHSNVSSYSIGFLDRDGRTLLVAQTHWNRLDVFDAETGANLTEREVSIRDSGRRDEPTSILVATAFGYNWDRPCAFVDDRTFVLALDDNADALEGDEAAAYRYRQLAFFEIPDLPPTGDANRWLEPSSFVECDVCSTAGSTVPVSRSAPCPQ